MMSSADLWVALLFLHSTRLRDDGTTRLRDYETAGLRDCETTGPRDCETAGLRDHGTPKTQAFSGVPRCSQLCVAVRGCAWLRVASWRQSGVDTTLGEFRVDGLY